MLYVHARSSIVHLCLYALLTASALLISPTATLHAQPTESLSTAVIPTMGLNDVTEGTLLFKTNQQGRYTAAPILSTDVQIAVTGIIARATVRQEFTNPSQKKGDWLEGIYVFPLPETAAVDHLRMHVGDRIIEGQIKERGEAKKAYEKAKQEGRRTSLVEQERPNIFTTSVANIGPGERIIVEIEYQETVRYDQGTFQLRFPMVVGQRYIPGTPVIVEGQDPSGSGTMLDTDRVPDASRITPPVQAPGQGSINPVSLSLSLTPGFPIAKVESLFHPVIVIPDPDGGYHISLKKDAVSAVYWARQKISALMDEAFTGTAEETVRKGVLDVALIHHLVSKYTSLVAVDVTAARLVSKPETELPQGTKSSEDQEKTAMIGLPKTGTNGQLQLLLGLLLLAAAAILWRKRSMLA